MRTCPLIPACLLLYFITWPHTCFKWFTQPLETYLAKFSCKNCMWLRLRKKFKTEVNEGK